jgi:hypothetical protein
VAFNYAVLNPGHTNHQEVQALLAEEVTARPGGPIHNRHGELDERPDPLGHPA